MAYVSPTLIIVGRATGVVLGAVNSQNSRIKEVDHNTSDPPLVSDTEW